MSRLSWFRLYTEARTDRKLDTLTDAEHRVWFSMMCYAFEQNGRRMFIECSDRDELAVECAHGDTDLLNTTIAKLIKPLKVLAVDGERITFINGEARQYDKPSDMPDAVADRVTRHRAVKRDVTPCHAKPPLEESRVEESREEEIEINPRSSERDSVESHFSDKIERDCTPEERSFITRMVPKYGHNAVESALGWAIQEGARSICGYARDVLEKGAQA